MWLSVLGSLAFLSQNRSPTHKPVVLTRTQRAASLWERAEKPE